MNGRENNERLALIRIDTFKIRKYGKYLRMDSTLAGFKRLSTKRRDMTLLFNPDIAMPQNYKAAACLYNVNRTKRHYTNPLVKNVNRIDY